MRNATLMILILSICDRECYSFSLLSSSVKLELPKSKSLLEATNNNMTPEAAELLTLLLKKHNSGAKPKELDRIESLMKVLEYKKMPFDPDKTLNGPLYAVLHQTGPSPFWEKRSVDILNKKNIKGQRYTKSSKGYFDLVNYAQLLGPAFSIQGSGICLKGQNDEDQLMNEKVDAVRNAFRSLLMYRNDKAICCPVDYTVEIQMANVKLFGRSFKIDVNGTGYMRVLYADENMRIITSPKDTNDPRWEEKAGLTVAQVRVDLIDPTFSSTELL